MIPNDNPARRITAILRIAYENGSPKERCDAVWMKALDVPPSRPDLLVKGLGLFMQQLVLARDELVRLSPARAESTTLWFDPIVAGLLSQSLYGEWTTFSQHASPQVVVPLGMVDELLSVRMHEPILTDEQIGTLISAFQELQQEVASADGIAEEVRLYVFRGIADILETLGTYRITGLSPVAKEVQALIGHSAIDKPYEEFLREHTFGQKLERHLQTLANAVTVVSSLPALQPYLVTAAAVIPPMIDTFKRLLPPK